MGVFFWVLWGKNGLIFKKFQSKTTHTVTKPLIFLYMNLKNMKSMNLRNLETKELLALKKKIDEELQRRETISTAVIWSNQLTQEKEKEKPKVEERAEFYLG